MRITEGTIEWAIMETIIYFDMFDYPLTAWETRKYLPYIKADYMSVEEGLSFLSGAGMIGSERGYYFIPGRSPLIDERQKRYYFAERKMRKARSAANIFRLIPWVKLVAVGNLIGSRNMRDDSDIDLFIVTGKRRIWMSRFICATIAAFFRWRPKDGDTRDKICLSFFISDEDMDLGRFRLPGGDDRYFSIWLAGLSPVFDRDDSYGRLIAENIWLADKLPNLSLPASGPRAVSDESRSSVIDWLEKMSMSWQSGHFPEKIKNLMNKDSRVVIDSKTLKMHVNDRRASYDNNFLSSWKRYVG